MNHYSLLIQWSQADKLYLVTIPEFSGITMQPCTHGKTYEDAVNNAQEAIESLLEYCQHEGIVKLHSVYRLTSANLVFYI